MLRALTITLGLLAALAILPGAREAAPPTFGTPGNTQAIPGEVPHKRLPERELKDDIPPTLEQLAKLRVYDFDPKTGLGVDGFTLWTVDDLLNPAPAEQSYLRLTGKNLEHGDYHLVVHTKAAPAVEDLFFYIRYDQDLWHPRQIETGTALGFKGDKLFFGKLNVPGVVCVGVSRIRPDINGGMKLAEGVICEVVFKEREFNYKPVFLNHAPDKPRNRATNIQAYLDPVIPKYYHDSGERESRDPHDCDVVLYWEETNTGDYNNDGEVSMTDLLPITRRYGRFTTDAYEDSWDWLVDGNRDGEVNRRDTWLIEENYGALLQGYRVYRRKADLPRGTEVLLPHRTNPMLPMSVHRPVRWNPTQRICYRYYDDCLPEGGPAQEFIYRIVPFNASDIVEGKDSDIEVRVLVSSSAVKVLETNGGKWSKETQADRSSFVRGRSPR